MKLLKTGIIALLLAVVGIVAQPAPSTVGAEGRDDATGVACDKNTFLTAPPWYRGLASGANCDVSIENAPGGGDVQQGGQLASFLQILALNIVEILMHVVIYVCVAFIIVGGFKYITGAGSPDSIAGGKKTIINAVIGLVIAIMAVGIINFIVNGIDKSGGNAQPAGQAAVNTRRIL